MLGLDKTNKKYLMLFIILLLVAFVFRILLSPYGNHIDLIINAGWGGWLWNNSPKNFYTNNVWIYAWPTQLPLINLIYAYNWHIYEHILWHIAYFGEVISTHNIFPKYFIWLISLRKWFGTDLYMVTPFMNGLLVSMKMIPIITDILIAIMIFVFGSRVSTFRKSLFISALFLLIPFSWYESALWGQYDQLSSFLVLLAFLLLIWKKLGSIRYLLSPVLIISAFQIKPTILFIIPFFCVVYLAEKPKFLYFLMGLLTSVLFSYYTFRPFVTGDFIGYVLHNIYPVVFNNDRYGLVNHAFNFWQLLFPRGGWSTVNSILGIKALYWGIFFWCIFLILGIMVYLKNKSTKALFTSLMLISGGGYIFMTGMVDRYYYLTVIVMIMMLYYYPKLMWYIMFVLLLFSVNLVYTWGYPFIPEKYVWNNNILIQLFSLLQTITFIVVARKLIMYNLGKVILKDQKFVNDK